LIQINTMQTYKAKNKGMSLVEVIIASAIMLVVVLASSSAYNTYVKYAFANEENVQASYLLEEGIEAINLIRDRGWTSYVATLTSGTTYYLYFDGTYWNSTTTPQYVDGQFLRSFTVANVNRDVNDDIANSGINDPKTKMVTVTLNYFEGHATSTKVISTYMTNINGN
jgi:prepilin-type N-terminal cleavage/methylation domain-containing protein